MLPSLTWKYPGDLAGHYAAQAIYKFMTPVVKIIDARTARAIRRDADRLAATQPQ